MKVFIRLFRANSLGIKDGQQTKEKQNFKVGTCVKHSLSKKEKGERTSHLFCAVQKRKDITARKSNLANLARTSNFWA